MILKRGHRCLLGAGDGDEGSKKGENKFHGCWLLVLFRKIVGNVCVLWWINKWVGRYDAGRWGSR